MSINMKTKKIILFLFATIFVCGQMWAQDDLPYRSFKPFNNDTIRYLDYNFTLRRDQYADKTVGDLLRDLELPVVYISKYVMQLSNGGNIAEGMIGMNLVIRLVGNGDWDESKDYYIKINLRAPVYFDDFYNALRADERNKERKSFYYWTPQLYELLKDKKINGIITNYRLFPDRRKILENAETKEQLTEQLNIVMETEKANWRNIIRAEKQAETQKKQD